MKKSALLIIANSILFVILISTLVLLAKAYAPMLNPTTTPSPTPSTRPEDQQIVAPPQPSSTTFPIVTASILLSPTANSAPLGDVVPLKLTIASDDSTAIDAADIIISFDPTVVQPNISDITVDPATGFSLIKAKLSDTNRLIISLGKQPGSTTNSGRSQSLIVNVPFKTLLNTRGAGSIISVDEGSTIVSQGVQVVFMPSSATVEVSE